jgi:hypothetical protein
VGLRNCQFGSSLKNSHRPFNLHCPYDEIQSSFLSFSCVIGGGRAIYAMNFQEGGESSPRAVGVISHLKSDISPRGHDRLDAGMD